MEIHWAVFGELNMGHALLASSGNPSFAAKLTVLTDRPGDPPVGSEWGPVVSGFPLGDQYVFLRTQPDPTVGRAGMVRSYAAYVPLTDLGALNNLSLVFDRLPDGLAKTTQVIAPLQIPDGDLVTKPDPSLAVGRVALARRLCAADTKLPIVWTLDDPYLPTVATLWGQLPTSLRANFAFMFQFAPEYSAPVAPTIVATLPDLAPRWLTEQLLRLDEPQVELTPTERWFAGAPEGDLFDRVMHDFSVQVPQFAKINLISSFVNLVTRLPDLAFADARRAVNIAARHSRKTVTSAAARARLFERLCQLVQASTPDELVKLRNLEDAALPELISPLQKAMSRWITDTATLSKQHIDLLEAAATDASHWWSKPFIEWLRIVSLKPGRIALVARLAASAPLLRQIAADLPVTESTERKLVEAIPKEMSPAVAGNLLALAVERRWLRLHAACLLRSQRGPDAIALHSAFAGSSEDGFEVLLEGLGFKTLVQAASETGAPGLVRFAGGIIAEAPRLHLDELPATSPHRMAVLQAAVVRSSASLDTALRHAVIEALNATGDSASAVADLCEACANKDAALLFGVLDPRALIEALPSGQREHVRRSLVLCLQNDVRGGRAFRFANPDALREMVSADDVLGWLGSVPLGRAAQAGVNAFACIPHLSDADCRKWLVALFTRSQRERLDHKSTAAIADLLGAVDFPVSARVVSETAEQFGREDAARIHERIRYKYQMARAYPRETGKGPSSLPKVLVATALPLEHDEVIRHLVYAKYDPDIGADVALWPPQKPAFEIYVTVTGVGNLSAQGASLRALNRGVKPSLAFFAGVCGGIKDVGVGDVVYSTKVYYYEGGKEEEGAVKSRPAAKETAGELVQLAHRVANTTWQPTESRNALRQPKCSAAVFASGELVFASTGPAAGNYQRLRSSFNDAQVVDMEAYGFLKAMQDEGVRLSMVIRGVSDMIAGKAESDATGSQPLAAKNAAAFLFALLSECVQLVDVQRKPKAGRNIFKALFGDDWE
jgi:nucleoside phosphorylase